MAGLQIETFNPPTASAAANEGLTWFTTPDGVAWSVREVNAEGVPGARAKRCLLFERAGAIRRVWRYPSDWAAAPSSELALICERL